MIYEKNAEISKYFMQVTTQKNEHNDAISALETDLKKKLEDKIGEVTFAKNNEINKLFNENRGLKDQVAKGQAQGDDLQSLKEEHERLVDSVQNELQQKQERLRESEDLLADVQQQVELLKRSIRDMTGEQ